MMPNNPADFVMRATRDAMADGLDHIDKQVTLLERAVVEDPGLAFDLAKTLVESVCKRILKEKGVDFTPDDNLPKLFRNVRRRLSFLPQEASHAADVRQSLGKTLGGLSTVVQGLSELRNTVGLASHGSSELRPSMDPVQALLAAAAADAIVGFLHRIHRQERAQTPSIETSYSENSEFNDFIDESHGMIQIFDAEFRPSDVLFQMESESYRVYLAEFEKPTESAVSDTEE